MTVAYQDMSGDGAIIIFGDDEAATLYLSVSNYLGYGSVYGGAEHTLCETEWCESYNEITAVPDELIERLQREYDVDEDEENDEDLEKLIGEIDGYFA